MRGRCQMRHGPRVHTVEGPRNPREACMEEERMMEKVRRVSPMVLVGLALGSMVVSAAFALGGKQKVANFIGQWVPSLLILATFDRLLQSDEGSTGRPASKALPNGVLGTPAGTAVTPSAGQPAGSTGPRS